MKKRWVKLTGLLALILAVAAVVVPGKARALIVGGIVHDPVQHAMHVANWASQIQRMQEQIRNQLRKIRQWDDDFTKLWGKEGGRVHDVLRTAEQVLYASEKPWDDRIATGEPMYNDLNRITRSPRSGFGAVKAVRDNFTFVRPTLDRYRFAGQRHPRRIEGRSDRRR